MRSGHGGLNHLRIGRKCYESSATKVDVVDAMVQALDGLVAFCSKKISRIAKRSKTNN